MQFVDVREPGEYDMAALPRFKLFPLSQAAKCALIPARTLSRWRKLHMLAEAVIAWAACQRQETRDKGQGARRGSWDV